MVIHNIITIMSFVCCRCNELILNNPLGGKYNGIVCLGHRSCVDCWFETTYKGKRSSESPTTKQIPLVDKPFKQCIGCINNAPFVSTYKPINLKINENIIDLT